VGRYLAVDLGATSGRVIAGRLEDGRLEIREALRFPNEPLDGPDGLRWDVDALFAATLDGLAAAVREGPPPDGVAVSTWGVDFGLVGPDGELLRAPEHYRSASPSALERVQRLVAPEALFARTGVQPSQINTVFRLGPAARRMSPPPGTTALLMPDLWTFWLSGARAAEHTIAGTTGLLDARTGDWDRELAATAGIDPGLLPAVREPASAAGTLRAAVSARIGASADVPVLRVASHDTASAVAAVPGDGHVAFVSCGTWALAGMEHDRPVLGSRAFRAGFTNEPGVGGRVRVMRNLTGLWLLEEALRQWAREGRRVTLADALRAAEAEDALDAFVDVAAPEFIAPGDVLARIASACRRTGQAVPRTPGEFARCILQSLALAYRVTLEGCAALTGRSAEVVHLVGGGARNGLLCRLTAAACGRPVLAGPAEATGVGNVLVQAMAAGEVGSLAELRAVVRRSTAVTRYDPPGDGRMADWAAAAALLSPAALVAEGDRVG
jgi:rhamnulokinase